MYESGKLFVFEGPDGSGKTTLSLALAEYLRSQGVECDYFAFPGKESDTLGKLVYELHHRAQVIGTPKITAASLQLLHVAAHIDAIESKIIPALNTGRAVVLDRFWWSTLVYGTVWGANREALKKMVQVEKTYWAANSPTIVFLIEREKPSDSPATGTDNKAVSEEYHKIALQEAAYYSICYIENDCEVADALSKVIKHITSVRS